MRHTPERHIDAADRTVKEIRRKTRKWYSSEDKIRIVLAGLRGEDSIAELCRQDGIAQSQHYRAGRKVPGGWQEASGWRYSPGRPIQAKCRACVVKRGI